jgi:predicted  nucleic acid-binding Zn-ribbon protein
MELEHSRSVELLTQELSLLRAKKAEAVAKVDEISGMLDHISDENEAFRYEQSMRTIKEDLANFIAYIREIQEEIEPDIVAERKSAVTQMIDSIDSQN